MPDMRKVFSSHIDAIGYDDASQEFFVKFKNGKTAVYQGVPADVAARVNASASIGSAVHELLRNQYAHGYAS